MLPWKWPMNQTSQSCCQWKEINLHEPCLAVSSTPATSSWVSWLKHGHLTPDTCGTLEITQKSDRLQDHISSDAPTFNYVRDNELNWVRHGAGLINRTRDNCLNELMVSNSLISDIIIIPAIPSQSSTESQFTFTQHFKELKLFHISR